MRKMYVVHGLFGSYVLLWLILILLAVKACYVSSMWIDTNLPFFVL